MEETWAFGKRGAVTKTKFLLDIGMRLPLFIASAAEQKKITIIYSNRLMTNAHALPLNRSISKIKRHMNN